MARATGLILTAQTPGSVSPAELEAMVLEGEECDWPDVVMLAEFVTVLASRYDAGIDGWAHMSRLLERARSSGDPVWEALALAMSSTDAVPDPRPALVRDRDLARAVVLLQGVEGPHEMLASAHGQCATGFLSRDLWDFAIAQTEAASEWLDAPDVEGWRRATALYNRAEILLRRLCARRQTGPDDALVAEAAEARAALRRVPLEDLPQSWRIDLHTFENLVDAIAAPVDEAPREPACTRDAEFAAYLDLAAALTEDDVVEARRHAAAAVRMLDGAGDPELHLLALTVDAELEARESGGETAGLRLGRELARGRVRTREAAAEAMASLVQNEQMAAEHTRLRVAAEVDALTQVANRHGFTRRVEAFAEAAELGSRADMPLVLVDVDHFKAVNDTHGHEVGDEVLEKVAAALVSEVRDSDVVARWGGDEFILLLDSDDLAGARRRCLSIAQRIRSGAWHETAEGLAVTVSVGLAIGKVTDLEALRTSADRALYRAKQAGRDGVSV